ncbi:hypothetical protein [Shimia biformata]|uniref:hypothetical protein n=1 Tax=Shimia biformata TaxID=1294299 RepID=UPI00194E03C8|nr:hypothetical protein [Shimia biformata]
MKIASKTAIYVARVALAACLIVPASQSMAKEQTYFCKFKPNRVTGWIPEQAGYLIDIENETAMVSDQFTHYAHKGAVKANYKRASEKRVELKYTIKNLPARSQTGETTKLSITYLVSLNIATGKAKMRATMHHPTGYDGNAGSGSCEIVKNKR